MSVPYMQYVAAGRQEFAWPLGRASRRPTSDAVRAASRQGGCADVAIASASERCLTTNLNPTYKRCMLSVFHELRLNF